MAELAAFDALLGGGGGALSSDRVLTAGELPNLLGSPEVTMGPTGGGGGGSGALFPFGRKGGGGGGGADGLGG